MINGAVQSDSVARLVEYLCKTRLLSRDEQINGIYNHWPDITPDEYLAAVKIYHALEFSERKTEKRQPRATFMGVSWKMDKENGGWCGKASWSL